MKIRTLQGQRAVLNPYVRMRQERYFSRYPTYLHSNWEIVKPYWPAVEFVWSKYTGFSREQEAGVVTGSLVAASVIRSQKAITVNLPLQDLSPGYLVLTFRWAHHFRESGRSGEPADLCGLVNRQAVWAGGGFVPPHETATLNARRQRIPPAHESGRKSPRNWHGNDSTRKTPICPRGCDQPCRFSGFAFRRGHAVRLPQDQESGRKLNISRSSHPSVTSTAHLLKVQSASVLIVAIYELSLRKGERRIRAGGFLALREQGFPNQSPGNRSWPQ